jgi:ABC-2 type transport system permease protein
MNISAPTIPVTSPLPTNALAPAPQPSGGWFTQLVRLVGWEVFLAWRRRAMLITLSAILLAIYVISLAFFWIAWVITPGGGAQDVIVPYLVYPGATVIAGQVFSQIGTLLLIVLAGALIGSDYTYGVHRLSLARGVGRGQLLAAQVIALALLALAASAIMLILGTLVGAVGSVMIGGAQAVSAAGLSELAGFWLAIALNAFAYELIALCVGTLGRSVAAAIAGPLVYIFVEVVVTGILAIFKIIPNPTAFVRFIAAIPDYLLGNNTNEVIQLSGQTPYVLLNYTGQLGWTHSLIVIVVYCVALIAVAYVVFRQRDVRE